MKIRLVKCFSLGKNGMRSSFFHFLLLLAVISVAGCRSVDRMERVTVADTLRIVQTDTIVKEVKVVVRDTVRIRVTDSVVVKVDAEGNVSKERYHEENKVTATERDTEKLDARKSESETESKTSERTVQEEEENPSAISKAKGKIADDLVVLFFSVISFIVGWIIRAVKDK